RSGCVHTPAPHTSRVQSLPSLVHPVPSGSLFAWHTPLPLHVLGLSQSESAPLTQGVPEGRSGCVHTPAPHTSRVQSLPSLVHPVSSGSLFAWQTPLPLQVSGLSQAES